MDGGEAGKHLPIGRPGSRAQTLHHHGSERGGGSGGGGGDLDGGDESGRIGVGIALRLVFGNDCDGSIIARHCSFGLICLCGRPFEREEAGIEVGQGEVLLRVIFHDFFFIVIVADANTTVVVDVDGLCLARGRGRGLVLILLRLALGQPLLLLLRLIRVSTGTRTGTYGPDGPHHHGGGHDGLGLGVARGDAVDAPPASGRNSSSTTSSVAADTVHSDIALLLPLRGAVLRPAFGDVARRALLRLAAGRLAGLAAAAALGHAAGIAGMRVGAGVDGVLLAGSSGGDGSAVSIIVAVVHRCSC